jgi:predicted neutral ceramidase superfamily lipid hydrolase
VTERGERLWASLGLLMLIVSAVPEKAIVSALELVLPFVVGAFWVRTARSVPDAVLRGAAVGLFAAIVIAIGTYLAIRRVQHDDVAPLALYVVVPFLLIAGPVFGAGCTGVALVVRSLLRRGRDAPF